jgi:hypothetical protein
MSFRRKENQVVELAGSFASAVLSPLASFHRIGMISFINGVRQVEGWRTMPLSHPSRVLVISYPC